MKALTYLDSGVLLAAWRGTEDVWKMVMQILDDPKREFVSSDFTKLELLPKAVYFKNNEEINTYKAFFAKVSIWAQIDNSTLEKALYEASNCGLDAVDSLHLILAHSAGAEQFITAEKSTKPLFRSKLLSVQSIS